MPKKDHKDAKELTKTLLVGLSQSHPAVLGLSVMVASKVAQLALILGRKREVIAGIVSTEGDPTFPHTAYHILAGLYTGAQAVAIASATGPAIAEGLGVVKEAIRSKAVSPQPS